MDGNFSINFGVTISPSFQIKIIELDKIKIKLKIWDTAGVERFSSINKNYYKEEMDLYLILILQIRIH